MKASSAPPLSDIATHPRLTLARAAGLHVWDTEGRRYLDATSGAFCVQLGYTRPDLVQAMAGAAARLPHARPSRFDSEESAAYQRELLAAAGAPFARAILTNSGSEAVDVAIKVAYRYQVATGHPERTSIRHERGHYHGATLGALGVTGVRARRAPYEGLLGAGKVQRSRSGESPISAEPREHNAAWILETIPAIGLGATVPPPGELARLRAECDATGALWIADEILTGFGRVGALFAWQRVAERGVPGGGTPDRGAIPDIVVFGKGAGAGFAPLAGVLIAERVAEALGTDGFAHYQTYGGNPIACAVGRRVLQALAEEKIYSRVNAAAPGFERALRALLDLPHVRDVRGMGFLWGVVLAENRAGAPDGRSIAARVESACRDRGVLVHGASAEGGDFILLAPPLVAAEREFEEISAAIAGAISAGAR